MANQPDHETWEEVDECEEEECYSCGLWWESYSGLDLEAGSDG